MHRLGLLSAACIVTGFAALAMAEDNPASPVATPVPGVTVPAAGPSATPASPATTVPAAPAAVAPAEVVKPAEAVKPPEPAKPVKATLKDGTPIEFEADGSVVILNADGSHTEAPDGVLTLKDGTTFNVKGGQKTAD